MKKIFVFIAITSLLHSCKQENGNSNTDKGELWAEQVESATSLIKPEGWTDEDWKSVAKGINRDKICNTIVESVLSGKQQAYDYITDAPIPTEQVYWLINKVDSAQQEDPATHKMKTWAVKTTVNPTTVKCREKWYFDKEKFTMKSEISTIALFTNVYSEEGDLRGVKALFYVKLNQ